MVKRNIPPPSDTTAHSPVATTAYRFASAALAPHLCLGFANTMENRLTGHPVERLNSYGDLVAWAREHGILSAQEAEQLAQEAVRRPVEAASTLARAMVLREAIYRIFSAVAAERSPEASDMMTLNIALAGALAVLHIVATEQGFAWAWSRGGVGLERVLWPIILSTVNLLTSNELPAVRECAAPNCGWLFLDTTRNRSRRWCDMLVCGNRAKARRHYERTKQAAGLQRQKDKRQARS
jgi:predicted RNA-binding Zn ribbon-like protein